jgi:hypothetical protein
MMARKRKAWHALMVLATAGLMSASTFDALGADVLADGRISYVNGGVGKEEADAMRALAADYPLELVFVRRVDNREEFVADVHLLIVDAKGQVMIDRAAQGPIFLARLPDGQYTITADYGGAQQSRRIAIGGGRHEKISLVWS